jgi:hypothetical protein
LKIYKLFILKENNVKFIQNKNNGRCW